MIDSAKNQDAHSIGTGLRVGLLLLSILAVECGVILFAWGQGMAPLTVFDYQVYERLGINILHHGCYSMNETAPFIPTMLRSPGYPVYVAFIYGLVGQNLLLLRVSQFVLLWIMAFAIYLLGCKLANPRVGAMAAGLAATYPSFVFTAPVCESHALTLCLTAVVALALVYLPRSGRLSLISFLSLGCLLGIYSIVRPAFQLIIILVAAYEWYAVDKRVGLGKYLPRIAALVIGFMVIMLPWIARNNTISSGRAGMRIMAGDGGFCLYASALQYSGELSYRLLKPEWEGIISEYKSAYEEAGLALPGSVEAAPYLQSQREIWMEHFFAAKAIKKMRTVSLGQIVASVPPRLFWLWSTSDKSPWNDSLVHRYAQLYHIVLMALILAGLYWERGALRLHPILLSLAAYQTGIAFVYHVEPRYTIEARVLLTIYAGIALARLYEKLPWPLTIRFGKRHPSPKDVMICEGN